MGKILVVNGADFSEVAVETVVFVENKYLSPYGFSSIGYDNPSISEGIRCNPIFLENGTEPTRIAVFDVSGLIGKTINIHCTQTPITDDQGFHRSRHFFSSDLGSITSIDDIPNMVPTQEPSKIPVSVVSLVDPSPVSAEKGAHTYTKVVPSGAKYLILSVPLDSASCVSAEDVYVSVVSA